MPNAFWPVPGLRRQALRCSGLDAGAGRGREPLWDYSALTHSLRGNMASVERVTQAFLEDCPRVAQSLRSAVREGDRSTIQWLAHRLKGNAGVMRADVVREAADRLQQEAEEGGDREGLEACMLALEQSLARLCEALAEFLTCLRNR